MHDVQSRFRWLPVVVLAFGLTGCSALHPLQGHSARHMPLEFKAPQRSLRRTIDLSILRQDPPPEHLVDSGDILGVYIEGILGNAENTPPVFVPEGENATPSIGYPVRVDTDGTISLPTRDPLPVRGMTIGQVRQAVRDLYTRGENATIQPGQDHIHVSLQKPRTYRVIVIREESGNEQGNRGAAATVNFEVDKRGTGRVVFLPAHRNDVLNALTVTGGLPGLDAETTVYVIRGRQTRLQQQWAPGHRQPLGDYRPPAVTAPGGAIRQVSGSQTEAAGPALGTNWGHSPVPAPTGQSDRTQYTSYRAFDSAHPLPATPEQWPLHAGGHYGGPPHQPTPHGPLPNVIRIPLKASPGELMDLAPHDIVLNDGDIVFVENRVTEFYYTAGLLGGGQFLIPRDYDIGVMDAIALAEAENPQSLPTSTIGGPSVLNQDVSVGASRVIIQRKMPEGGRMAIEVNLYDAMKYPDDQVIIQPEDRIVLRYTRTEAALAFFERYFLNAITFGAANSLLYDN